jgi:hypothetical protein
MNGEMDNMFGSAAITITLPIDTVIGCRPATRAIKTAILTAPVIGLIKNNPKLSGYSACHPTAATDLI